MAKSLMMGRLSRFFEGQVRCTKTFSSNPKLIAHLGFKKMMQANH
jgi:hypothetical protein